MGSKIEIVVIANAGLLVRSGRARILIDGIYEIQSAGNHRPPRHDPFQAKDLFTPVPEEIMDRIVSGSAEFDGIDALVFSHYHRDHFSSEKTIACLGGNRIGSVFLPEDRWGEASAVRAHAKAAGVEIHDMRLSLGERAERVIEDIRIEYLRTPHCSEYTDVDHYSFLIGIDDRTIYVSCDADHADPCQMQMLDGRHVDIAFFNPLHFQLRPGRQVISRINPDKVIMYHVPFEKDDRYGFRRLSERIMNRYRDSLPPSEIIAQPLQTILI